jgi:hypothetical protein
MPTFPPLQLFNIGTDDLDVTNVLAGANHWLEKLQEHPF